MDLLIDTYGTFIGSTGERISLRFPKVKRRKEYSIHRLKKIVVLRPSSISTHAVRLALEHDVDIVYLGSFGKPVGRIFASEPRGLASLRKAQLVVSSDSTKALELARAFVRGKCENQIGYLKSLQHRKRGVSFEKEILQAESMLASISDSSTRIGARDQLLGAEGYIADRYWSALKKLHKFPGRIPQGRDKFNSTLNYGYGILYNEVERACLYIGLDPYLGLFHSERYGKPALVLDLVEEFRVPLIDSAVIPLFLEKKLNSRDFERVSKGEYRLSPSGKAKVVGAVFMRLNQTIRYRGKMRTGKSVIEEQSKALARLFLEKEKAYKPVALTAFK